MALCNSKVSVVVVNSCEPLLALLVFQHIYSDNATMSVTATTGTQLSPN